MAIKVLKIDQTDCWCDEIRENVTRIFSVFVFDSGRKVYCCELTPSYECHFVESQFETPEDMPESEREHLTDEILQGDASTDRVSYYHCHRIDSFPAIQEGFLPDGQAGVFTITGLRNRTPAGRLEEALEYARTCSV
ncbi:hypothetical protein HQ520_04070 [bacterium]|nr:hypothetical protein [bacterium]